LIGNYGVPENSYWESDSIQVSGLIVSNYIDTPSHIQSQPRTVLVRGNQTLRDWLKSEKIPALEITDTRFLNQKIRTKGTMIGKMVFRYDVPFYDHNKENLVAKVSTRSILEQGYSFDKEYPFKKMVLLIDCGAKKNIERCLIKRGVRVMTVPWDFDPFEKNVHLRGAPQAQHHLGGGSPEPVEGHDSSEVRSFDAIVISNGPGDPKMADKTIQTIKKAIDKNIPILGVCLGHQLLTLAAGGDTRKLKFGHRSQNQPCIMASSNRCFITTQNHGFEVFKIPNGFKPWFTNANDGSNEGIIHDKLPIMSVQFHPEANPGPNDTEWIFDFFLDHV
jgi:carbamoyl-phosphate synthase small subunit